MRCVVTGAAGFIGSHLCERLVRDGHSVVGLDAFIPYYPRPVKEANLAALREQRAFTFHELDLRRDPLPLDAALDGADVIFHLAAMAGLARSWTDFSLYESCNFTATRCLIEAALRQPRVPRLVYACTSSVYGRFSAGDETLPTRPISPYGVTKLAGEYLCRAYAEEKGLPFVSLRYFSVYGPRQRPDMGYHKFICALLHNEAIEVFSDGQQVRGNTFVSDCIEATVAAVRVPLGEVYNVGGGETASVWDILDRLEKITGRKAVVRKLPARAGDQRNTFADTGKLFHHIGWKAKVGLDEGLSRQVEWQRGLLKKSPSN
jgi:nucleoside-diphosphate-sugar epimerase